MFKFIKRLLCNHQHDWDHLPVNGKFGKYKTVCTSCGKTLGFNNGSEITSVGQRSPSLCYKIKGQNKAIVNVNDIFEASEFAKVKTSDLELIELSVPSMFRCCLIDL